MTTSSFSRRLWSEIEPIFAAILEHPFIRGVADGTLRQDCFLYFVLQDAVYLQSYAKALSGLGGRAPTLADTEFFALRAGRVVAVERALHESLLAELGLDERAVANTEPSPTTLAYTSFILSNVSRGSFLAGLSSVLPCYWIYLEVGNALSERGSPNHLYQRWIDTYGSEEFSAAVESVLGLVDRLGEVSGPDELEEARRNFIRASRYEWMFWDAAWREESWPAAAAPATPV